MVAASVANQIFALIRFTYELLRRVTFVESAFHCACWVCFRWNGFQLKVVVFISEREMLCGTGIWVGIPEKFSSENKTVLISIEKWHTHSICLCSTPEHITHIYTARERMEFMTRFTNMILSVVLIKSQRLCVANNLEIKPIIVCMSLQLITMLYPSIWSMMLPGGWTKGRIVHHFWKSDCGHCE